MTADGDHFDTVLEGRRSYQIGLDAGVTNAYPHLRHVVFSRTLAESPDPGVELVATDPVAYVRELKRQQGKGIWLVGGATLAAALRPEIDRLVIKRAPIAIGAGIPLFAGEFAVDTYRPVHSDALDSGVVVTTYERPAPTLPTERLDLRPLTRQQAERILADDRAGQPWSPGYPRADDRDVARMALRHDAADDPWFGALQIVDRDTGLVVGGLGCFGPPGDDRTVEFGYGVAPEVEGRGIATEAVRGLLDHVFATGRVDLVRADTTHDNVGSQRVLEKAGLHRYASDDRLHHYERRRTT